jgi:hypothetical protein
MVQVIDKPTGLQIRDATGAMVTPAEERVRFSLHEKEIGKDELPGPKAKIEFKGVGYVSGIHLDPVGKKTRAGYAATAVVKITDIEFTVAPPDPTLFDEAEEEDGENDA